MIAHRFASDRTHSQVDILKTFYFAASIVRLPQALSHRSVWNAIFQILMDAMAGSESPPSTTNPANGTDVVSHLAYQCLDNIQQAETGHDVASVNDDQASYDAWKAGFSTEQTVIPDECIDILRRLAAEKLEGSAIPWRVRRLREPNEISTTANGEPEEDSTLPDMPNIIHDIPPT